MGGRRLTRWQLEGHGDAVVDRGALWPRHLGVERVQHTELHVLEEAATLVLQDDGHCDLAVLLQAGLDIIRLQEASPGTGLRAASLLQGKEIASLPTKSDPCPAGAGWGRRRGRGCPQPEPAVFCFQHWD